MQHLSCLRWGLCAATVFVALTLPAARADLIFLKDGTILQGKLSQEMKLDFDPVTHEPFRLASGFFLIDDGPRRNYFCQTQVDKVIKREEGSADVRFEYSKGFVVPPRSVPPIHQVVHVDPWDDKWERKIKINSSGHEATARQRLSLLTPQFASMDSLTYSWKDYYLTRELGPDLVKALLASNPKFADDPKLKEDERLQRRFRECDFYAQAGWFDFAEAGLTKLAKDFPSRKEQIDAAREALRKSSSRERFELIKRLHVAGQYKAVKSALDTFKEDEAADVTAADFRTFRAAFEESATKYNDTLRMLDAVAREMKDAPEGLASALAGIRSEMHPERAARLEAFLGQALQAERQRQRNVTPQFSAPELAALAVTGFLLGGPSSETKPETALRLWHSRKLVLDYLRSDDAGIREKLLKDYAAHKNEYSGIDEICQLIPQLPPEAPEPDTKSLEMELKAGDTRRSPLYLVKLPPEYSHNRPYPVLVALPAYGEPAQDTVRRHDAACAENGYVLVVPRWEQKTGSVGYNFSEREHQIVLDVLRDVRRRFQVDSDRVFLTGTGAGGGDMAFDFGLSHPDLFAGVVPIAAGPSYFSEAYWRSAQYLPFYVICGDRSGDGNKKVRELFNNWVPRGFGSLWVQYKGRGVEWFGGELPLVFDWMRNKRRANPIRQLGSDGLGGPLGSEFYTMRQCDNHFYWLSTDEVESRRCNSIDGWSNQVEPARMSGRIDQGTNQVYVNTRGLRQVTVWLGRTAKGENMVDFDKPVTVWVNLAAHWSNRKLTPSLEVLLKDLIERGDRQRLYLARVDVKVR
jgi:pimeloyl-ACP methyl ester carboxylesterase